MNNRRSILTLACILTLASLGEARADGPRLSRKVASYIALGAGGWLLSEAYQARREANRADERYERAESKSDAQIFYDERRRFDTRAVVMGAMGLGAVAWSVKGADRGWMTSRRAWGWALCGGSAILLVKSWDFRQQGDDAYRRYQKASTPQEAERFLDRANSRDTQSQMSWMTAAAFALAGWQLLALGDEKQEQGVAVAPRLELGTGQVGIRLSLAWDSD